MLSNQVVVITGGAGLIGQEFVKAIVKQNGIAIIADINEKSLFLSKTGLYVMPEERSIDIDSELDYKFVAFLMKENDVKK